MKIKTFTMFSPRMWGCTAEANQEAVWDVINGVSVYLDERKGKP